MGEENPIVNCPGCGGAIWSELRMMMDEAMSGTGDSLRFVCECGCITNVKIDAEPRFYIDPQDKEKP